MTTTLDPARTLDDALARSAKKGDTIPIVGIRGLAGESLDFVLPGELEAREPPEVRGLARDEVRLLVSYRERDRVRHARFRDLPDVLHAGDLLVANDSATLPAALTAHRADGEMVVLHLSTPRPGELWVVEVRSADLSATGRGGTTGAFEDGEQLTLPDGGTATLVAPYAGSRRLWEAQLSLPVPTIEYLSRWGRPITYPHLRAAWPLEMYQTIFAREPGSAEMPSAGRAFSPTVLEGLRRAGVGLETVTLHTGVSSLEAGEPPYPEAYRVPAATADAVRAVHEAHGRVIAVGTTVVRALESTTDAQGRVIASQGLTDLIVTPERGVWAVDGLLTGFHEPRASHLSMLEAIAGRRHLAHAYREALAGRYLWHEFGDLHLILP